MSAESTRCLERFCPDYEAKAAAEPSVAQTGPPPQEKKEDEISRMRQSAAACESNLARVRKEQDQCVQQAQLTTQTDKTEITRLTAQVAEERKKSDQRIQDMLAKTAPRPGIEALAAFPSGEASAALVVLSIIVLIAGFLLGRHGRSRRRSRLISGGISALVALGVYVGSVALLPDTRFAEQLVAVTTAILIVTLRALVRSQLELRGGSGPAAPSP